MLADALVLGLDMAAEGSDAGSSAAGCWPMSDETCMMWSIERGGVMVLHGVEMITRAEAIERRAQLLEQLGLSEAEMRDRAASYDLTLQQSALVDEIAGLDYLLAAASR